MDETDRLQIARANELSSDTHHNSGLSLFNDGVGRLYAIVRKLMNHRILCGVDRVRGSTLHWPTVTHRAPCIRGATSCHARPGRRERAAETHQAWSVAQSSQAWRSPVRHGVAQYRNPLHRTGGVWPAATT